MKAGVFVEPGRVEINNEVPIPKVEGENEAVIRVHASAVRTSGGSAASIRVRMEASRVMKPSASSKKSEALSRRSRKAISSSLHSPTAAAGALRARPALTATASMRRRK